MPSAPGSSGGPSPQGTSPLLAFNFEMRSGLGAERQQWRVVADICHILVATKTKTNPVFHPNNPRELRNLSLKYDELTY